MTYRLKVRTLRLILLVIAISMARAMLWPQYAPGTSLPRLVHGNEILGRKLLLSLQASSPEENAVISPLPMALILGLIQDESRQEKTPKQLSELFEWGEYPRIGVASRMMVAAFEAPEKETAKTKAKNHEVVEERPSVESAWLSNSISYRDSQPGWIPFSANFVRRAKRDFGIQFVPVEGALSAKDRPGLHASVPQISSKANVLFRSTMHVQMIWEGNLFSRSKPHPASFKPEQGDPVSVSVLDSELGRYGYRKTDTYEVVELPCYNGTMTVFLPLEGKSVRDVESTLVSEIEKGAPEFEPQFGHVTMPIFHLHREIDVRKLLEGLGVKEIFENLGAIATEPKSHVEDFRQSIDLLVNRDGIQGDSESTAGIVVGGLFSVPKPFDLKLNRPFVFLIRERETSALTYAGVVMDPSKP
jgi:serine protease inhibitor